ncbi:hypothetical protein C8J25_107268 [Sphingomonas faeni]|uniref:Uncharacterized protein n=1 Tax=Sphingomonas faeni TaxID=185950 RepID=A0A2T5U230_9SPHN|nr:hypothetical protein [Sphingomonas faeni]PTW45583.1 hypothetical protein C8J25_107268 [Sphingomonas faeni]
MKYLNLLKEKAKAALQWSGDEAHRRAVSGVIASGFAFYAGHELDSAFVDGVLLIVIPALLSMWSSRTPNIDA